jgi:hypothetical protein
VLSDGCDNWLFLLVLTIRLWRFRFPRVRLVPSLPDAERDFNFLLRLLLIFLTGISFGSSSNWLSTFLSIMMYWRSIKDCEQNWMAIKWYMYCRSIKDCEQNWMAIKWYMYCRSIKDCHV